MALFLRAAIWAPARGDRPVALPEASIYCESSAQPARRDRHFSLRPEFLYGQGTLDAFNKHKVSFLYNPAISFSIVCQQPSVEGLKKEMATVKAKIQKLQEERKWYDTNGLDARPIVQQLRTVMVRRDQLEKKLGGVTEKDYEKEMRIIEKKIDSLQDERKRLRQAGLSITQLTNQLHSYMRRLKSLEESRQELAAKARPDTSDGGVTESSDDVAESFTESENSNFDLSEQDNDGGSDGLDEGEDSSLDLEDGEEGERRTKSTRSTRGMESRKSTSRNSRHENAPPTDELKALEDELDELEDELGVLEEQADTAEALGEDVEELEEKIEKAEAERETLLRKIQALMRERTEKRQPSRQQQQQQRDPYGRNSNTRNDPYAAQRNDPYLQRQRQLQLQQQQQLRQQQQRAPPRQMGGLQQKKAIADLEDQLEEVEDILEQLEEEADAAEDAGKDSRRYEAGIKKAETKREQIVRKLRTVKGGAGVGGPGVDRSGGRGGAYDSYGGGSSSRQRSQSSSSSYSRKDLLDKVGQIDAKVMNLRKQQEYAQRSGKDTSMIREKIRTALEIRADVLEELQG